MVFRADDLDAYRTPAPVFRGGAQVLRRVRGLPPPEPRKVRMVVPLLGGAAPKPKPKPVAAPLPVVEDPLALPRLEHPPSPDAVARAVAAVFGIRPAEMYTESRSRCFARPRQVAMWILAESLPAWSLPRIGRAFKRDHTTVMSGLKRVAMIAGRDAAFRDDLRAARVACGLPSTLPYAVRGHRIGVA